MLAALERGGVVALGGGALGSERIRAALDGRVDRLLPRQRGGRLGAGRTGIGPAAGRRPRRLPTTSSTQRAARSTRRRPTSFLPRGGDDTAAPRPRRWLAALRAHPGAADRLGARRRGRVPRVVGPGARSCSATARRALGRQALRRSPTRRRSPAAPAARRHAEPPIEFAGGEQRRPWPRPRRARAAGRRRNPPRRRDCRHRRRRRRRPRRLLRGRLPARRPGRPGPDDARRPGRLGATAARPGWTCPPARTTSAPTTSRPPCSPTRPRSRACRTAELAAGYAEVVKTALIAGGALWERVRDRAARRPSSSTGDVVFDCALTKIGVVAEDERDGGRRAVLNLGHTVGHAIETATGYGRYRHGEAVGLGLLAALRLSGARRLRDEVADAARRPPACRPSSTPAIDLDAVLAATAPRQEADRGGRRLRARSAHPATSSTASPSTRRTCGPRWRNLRR